MTQSLVQISPQYAASLDPHALYEREVLHELPILILFPHNRCNCRCVMCDIWRIREVRQIRREDLLPHLESLRAFKTKWVVLSGGEALLHDDLRGFLELLREENIRITLLSTGLLLAEHAKLITELVDDVIVSLDGPRETHNAIRRVRDAYEQMAVGIAALRALRADMQISARSTVQRNNFRQISRTVDAARDLGLDSISFLAVDATSTAFNREDGWKEDQQAKVMLTTEDATELVALIDGMSVDNAEDFRSGFIKESPEKMRRFVRHFRSALGEMEAVAPRCNAPWVSAVVESDGTVRPCFFHPPVGNFFEQSLSEIVNGEKAMQFRANLDVESDPVCKRCVCSLHYTA
jgi:Fe-coproporphyrin III synthase